MARCGFDLQPTNGITRLRQRPGRNRGRDRGNDATTILVPHRGENRLAAASCPREKRPKKQEAA